MEHLTEQLLYRLHVNAHVGSIVRATARTGEDNNNYKIMVTTDQTNKDIRSKEIPVARMLITVAIIFKKLKNFPAAICREK